jgi:hypothetical protein
MVRGTPHCEVAIEMQCPYCKAENMEGAANCAVCRLPLAAARAEQPDGIWLIPPAFATDAAHGPNSRPPTLAEQVEVLQVPEEQADDPEEKAADRWLPRIVFFIGIFIVGLGLGLSGSNWFKLASDASTSHEDAKAKPRAGISRSYLLEDDPVPAPDRQRQDALLDDEPASSSSSTSAVPAPPAPPAPVTAVPAVPLKPAPALARPKERANAAATAPDSAKPKTVAKRRPAAQQKKVEPSPVPAAAASVRTQPARRPNRNGSRNSSRKKAPPHHEPSHQEPSHQETQPGMEVQLAEMKSGSKRLQLNQCENRESWIEREKCRWNICSNQWGQHGCPAYPAPQHQQ